MTSKKNQSSNKNGKSQQKKQGNQLKNVVALTGIAFQMAAITGLGAFIGHKLDEHYQNSTAIYTIVLTFVGFGIAMYGVVKQANKISNSKDE